MGQARHPLSLLLVLAMAVAASAAGGCGSSDEGGEGATAGGGETTSKAPAGAAARSCSVTVGVDDLRVSGVDCEEGEGVVIFWRARRDCRAPAGASRVSCRVAGYRCLGAQTDRGLVVSCARPGRSISFVARPG